MLRLGESTLSSLYNIPFLSLVILLVLKSSLSDINTVDPAFIFIQICVVEFSILLFSPTNFIFQVSFLVENI